MPELKTFLNDIMKLANPDLLSSFRIVTDDECTTVSSTNGKVGTFILNATMYDRYRELEGIVGIKETAYLRGLLSMKALKSEDTDIHVSYKERNGERFPDEIHFNNNEMKASYRLMHKAMIEPMPWFQSTTWEIEFSLTKDIVNSFTQMAGLLSEAETSSSIRVVGDDLVAFIGAEHGSSHKAQINLASGVAGNTGKLQNWPMTELLYVMRISDENTIFRISNNDIMNIEIKTDLGIYNFYIHPNQ